MKPRYPSITAGAAAGAACLFTFFALLSPACMNRPVLSITPSTKTNFSATIKTQAVDRVDLLFSIDNSASMGDKQEYLRKAIPDLITRLVTPNCVDPKDPNKVLGVSHDDGQCAQGQVEFPPVHDMHIGIVSSALGPRLGDVCAPPKPGDTGPTMHNDDQAHLLTRATDAETPSSAVGASGFLAWFPGVKENDGRSATPGSSPITSATDLDGAFQDLVTGVHQYGCGIESQLESWYRFLVQPDPYKDLALDAQKKATWVDVDATILKERHDFLRPDSLVAIVVLTDENDSEIDIRSVGQTAYNFMSSTFHPPHGTSACAANPSDPSCTPCEFAPNKGAGDPACATPTYGGMNDWGFDLNLRHVHMKQKYGIDVQFPITRYVAGLTSTQIPDRNGEYPPKSGSYVGSASCTNPLFAASLPDGSSTDPKTLCNLPVGTRSADNIFYAHIGGVPHELLHFTPGDPNASALTDADWVKILGKDPTKYDYTGIDPHMIESFSPRAGLAPPGSPSGTDPINGHEWITDQGEGHQLSVDRQFACTFPLPQPRDCSQDANKNACDCPSHPTLTPEQLPPVCDPNNQVNQTAAKAYPTIRELLLAKLVGKQGIVSSICPVHVQEQEAGDPLYGYRPAVSAIVDRLKDALTAQCVPQHLVPDADGKVPCLVLATLQQPPGPGACDPKLGMSPPEPAVLKRFVEDQRSAWLQKGGASTNTPDPQTLAVCQVQQLLNQDLVGGSCKTSTKPGWCYVEGAAAGKCSQEVLFSAGLPPSGATVSLQCIEASAADGG